MKKTQMIGSLIVAIMTIASQPLMSQDQASPTIQEVQQWIDQLANKSPMRTFRTPADELTQTERESLKPVSNAYQKLSKHFMVALPLLVKSLGDDRFSHPERQPSSSVYYNLTVGATCEDIIQQKVQLRTPSYVDQRNIGRFVKITIDVEWYERMAKKNLFEMQVDSLDWLLAHPCPQGMPQQRWEKSLNEVRQFRSDFMAKGMAHDYTFSLLIDGK